MRKPRPWSLRPATREDIGALLALFERSFGKRVSPERWNWKLYCRPTPVENAWIAEIDRNVVCHFGGIPVRVRHRGGEHWAMVGVDVMTDPAHRRRGLLTAVGAEMFARWREAGVAFVLGFPNELWGSRIAALGFKPMMELRWWVRWLDPAKAIAVKLGLPWLTRADAANPPRRRDLQVTSILDLSACDELGSRLAEEGLVRDGSWYRWRYLEAVPSGTVLGAWRNGRLVGAAAFCKTADPREATGIIAEVVATDLAAHRVLLGESCHALRRAGAARAAMLVQARTSLEEAAFVSGFLPRPASYVVQAVDLGAGHPRAAVFHGGDFDVV